MLLIKIIMCEPRKYPGLLLLVLALGTAGCTEDVAAPSGVDAPFSMYGILNPRLATQTLLVSPIEPLLYDLPETIDAVVTSTDLETGRTTVWRDSVITGEQGQLDHIYHADFRARFGGTYRVEVVRSDGAVSAAEAHVPGLVDVSWKDLPPTYLDVYVLGENFHLLAVDVVYVVRWYEKFGDPDPAINPCEAPVGTYAFTYHDEILETEGGYRLRVDLDVDNERVLGGYQLEFGPLRWQPGRNGLALTGMEVRLLVAEPAWAPPVFEASVLADPNVMSNVTNGLGFVGGGYNHDRRVFPGSELAGGTGFFDFLMRPPGQCLDYCSCGLG